MEPCSARILPLISMTGRCVVYSLRSATQTLRDEAPAVPFFFGLWSGALLRSGQRAMVGKAVRLLVSDDHVIDDGDSQQGAAMVESGGECAIVCAGGGIT